MLPRIRGKYRLRMGVESDLCGGYVCMFQIQRKQLWWWRHIRFFSTWFDAIDFFDEITKRKTN
jgi:hypothetical protein